MHKRAGFSAHPAVRLVGCDAGSTQRPQQWPKGDNVSRETFTSMVGALGGRVAEIYPWDLVTMLTVDEAPMLLDIRCPHEFAAAHIDGSINVPRGVLEMAADYGYEETVPPLVAARDERVVVICRSGNRSLLAAATLQRMGYRDVVSLKTGLRGWNDFDQALVSASGSTLHGDAVERMFTSQLTAAQLGPQAVNRHPPSAAH